MIGISDLLNHSDEDSDGSASWSSRLSKTPTRRPSQSQTDLSRPSGLYKYSLSLSGGLQNPSSNFTYPKCSQGSSSSQLYSISNTDTEPSTPLSSSGSLFSNASSSTDVSSDSSSSLTTFPSRKTSEVLKKRPPLAPLVRSTSVRSRLPKSRIHKDILSRKSFVKLAIRGKTAKRESIGSRSGSSSSSSTDSSSKTGFSAGSPTLPLLDDSTKGKLHVRSLESGLRIKLSLTPTLVDLYHHLVPFTHKQKRAIPVIPSTDLSIVEGGSPPAQKFGHNPKQTLASKSVKLIDNNLVDLTGLSNKVLKSFSLINDKDSLTTYNSPNTAIHSVFGIDEYSLVRVTRSTTDEDSGSVVLKLETAHPGDCKLIDDPNFVEEMFYSLGNHDDDPSNLFIKKVVARPRYKSDMKIYLIPRRINCSLYINERMFERDLFNGVIEFNYDNNTITDGDKDVFVTFPYQPIVEDYQRMMEMSNQFEAGLIPQPAQ